MAAASLSAKRGTFFNYDALRSVTHHYNGHMRMIRDSQAIVEHAACHVASAHDSQQRLTRTTFGQRDAGGSDPYKGWTYDDLGNHLTQDDDGATTAGLYNAVNEQTARGGTGLTWSRTGNLTEDDASGGGQQYSYDRDNMLTRVEDASNNLVEQYTYDALGRRIVAGDGTNDKRFYYSIRFQILEQTDGSDVVQKAFVWGNYIDELLLMEDTAGDGGTAGADCFALRHHNYNVVALIDDDGTVVERYDYNPYGQRFVLDADFTDDADGASDYLNPMGHQGLHHDKETGLVYNRARMLHPTLGRFMQRDPLGYVDGMNQYQYLRSAPLLHVDPKGTRTKLDCYAVCHQAYGKGSSYVTRLCYQACRNSHEDDFKVSGVPLLLPFVKSAVSSIDMPSLDGERADFEAYKKTLFKIRTPWKVEPAVGVEIDLTVTSCCNEDGSTGVMADVDASLVAGGCIGITGGDSKFNDKWGSPTVGPVSGRLPDCEDTIAANAPKVTVSAKAGAGVSVSGETSVTLSGKGAGELDYTVGIDVGWWAGGEICVNVSGGVSGTFVLNE